MNASLAVSLASLEPAQRATILAELTDDEAAALEYDWSFWGRPNQLPPPGDWTFWLLLAGRGFGKTRTGAEWVRAEKERCKYIALVAPTAADSRDVMVEGPAGILATAPPWDRPTYEPSKRRITWRNGATATTFSADEPERLRGPNHDAAWCLTGDTPVTMGDGTLKALADVERGDSVMTRSGPRRVLASEMTKRKAEVFRVEFVDGRAIIGTSDHPVWVDGHGFIPIGQLQTGMGSCALSASNSAADCSTSTPRDTTAPTFSCIERSGKPHTDPSLKVSKSTISTEIRPTIGWRTSNFSLIPSTARCISRKRLGRTERGRLLPQTPAGADAPLNVCSAIFAAPCAATSTAAALSIHLGSAPHRASNVRDRGRSEATSGFALIAGPNTVPPRERRSTVRASATPGHAKPGHTENREPCNAQNAIAPSHRRVSTPASAGGNALSLFTLIIASVERLARRADVYDIAVEGEREFFASGVLVHNCDELGAWRYAEAWDMLMMGLRLGSHPRCVITTTPRPIKVIRDLLTNPACAVTRGSTYDNRANLAASFFDTIVRKYEGTRLGRQELNAELLDDVPGALWKRADIDAARVASAPPELRRIVVAIDPAVSTSEGSDETGIVVAGADSHGNYYVLADLSCRDSPDGWARRAVGAYRSHRANWIIAEVNNGGDLVRHTVHTVDKAAPFMAVHAARGKVTRAEPVAALYEQHRVRHVGSLGTLEDQMCAFTSDFDRQTSGYSPDRVDALVWALSHLMQTPAAPIVAPFVHSVPSTVPR